MNTVLSILAGSVGFAALSLVPAAQGQTTGGTPPAAATAEKKTATADACGLLTKEEVATAQGAPITDAQGQIDAGGKFRITQCFYAAAETNKSVSVMLTQTQPAPAAGESKRTVRQFWHDTFDRFTGQKENGDKDAREKDKAEDKDKEKDKGAEREEDSDKEPPRRIEGLGEDAYWTRSHVGAALYVLKGENLLRISIGGPDNEETRLNKSKTLAAKALARL